MTGHEMFLLFVCIWGLSMSAVGLISLAIAKYQHKKKVKMNSNNESEKERRRG